jgi:hypothetical protein
MDESEAAPWGLMAIMAIALLSAPVLVLFNHRTPVFGIPLILLYLFGLWGGLILLSTCYRPRE